MFKVMAIIIIIIHKYSDRLIPGSLSPEWKIKTAEIHTRGDLCRLRRRVNDVNIWIFITGSFNFIDQWDRQKLPMAGKNVVNRCHFVQRGGGLASSQNIHKIPLK